MIKRIINKETGLFIRDDFAYDEETEIALEVEPAQGFYRPRWNGTEWIEGLTQEEIGALKANTVAEPTIEERLQALELLELERLFGGM